MGTLDWAKLNVDQLCLEVDVGKGEVHDLRICLNLPTLENLIGELRPIYTEGSVTPGDALSVSSGDPGAHAQGRAEELRLVLPAGWTLFFKRQISGSSRMMVAHPEPELWVGTVLLAPSHGLQILTQLSEWVTQEGALSAMAQGEPGGIPKGADGLSIVFRDQLPKERTPSLFSAAVNNLNLTISLLGS